MSAELNSRSPIGVIHDETSLAAELMPEREGRADRAACISGRRLNVDAAKRRYPPHLAIGDRVHGAAARKRQVRRTVSLLRLADQMEKRFFIHRLHRAGDVAMPILERIGRLAPRPEKVFQRRREQIAELRRVIVPLI